MSMEFLWEPTKPHFLLCLFSTKYVCNFRAIINKYDKEKYLSFAWDMVILLFISRWLGGGTARKETNSFKFNHVTERRKLKWEVISHPKALAQYLHVGNSIPNYTKHGKLMSCCCNVLLTHREGWAIQFLRHHKILLFQHSMANIIWFTKNW